MDKKKKAYEVSLKVIGTLIALSVIAIIIQVIIGNNAIKEKQANLPEPIPYEITEYSEDIPSGLYTRVEIQYLSEQTTEYQYENGIKKNEIGTYYDFITADGKQGVIYLESNMRQENEALDALLDYCFNVSIRPNMPHTTPPDPVTLYGRTIKKPKAEFIDGNYSSGVLGVGESYISGSSEHELEYPPAVEDYDMLGNLTERLFFCFLILGIPFILVYKKYKKNY